MRAIAGGATRQESTYLGLLACEDADIACIHDCVRPFVTKDIIQANILAAYAYGAVDTCIPSADTLVHAPGAENICAIPLRNEYLRGQTPQTFRYRLILQAHQRAREKGLCNQTDDCALVLDMGHPIRAVAGSEYNIKITTALDLCLAEQILRLRNEQIQPSSHSLQSRRYIVTGGTGGIGKALCEHLEKEGAIAIPLSRSSSPHAADLTSFEAASSAFERIAAAYGPVDGLINSVGRLKLSALADLSPQDIEEQLSANLKALIFCCKCALVKDGGHIVNIASSSYARGRKDFTIYSSAKAAVVNFTQGLSEERPELCINAVVPQRTKTSMRLANFSKEDPDSLLDPQEVAGQIIALLKMQDVRGCVMEIRKK
jgi:2-C-methyl-D-erythritol 4-phosphate cytidylyltransferase